MPGETLITETGATTATDPATTATTTTSTTATTGETTGSTTQTTSTTGEGTGESTGDGAKTPEQIAADEAAAKASEEAAKGAPEKYEDFKAPEGAALDAAVMGKFADAARALNLPQDKAQQLIDQMAPVMAARQAEQIEQLRTDWAAQSTADKEFGGDKLTENLVHAKKALAAFATPALETILNETGLGNHPELVRFMVRAGKAIGEDKIITGGTPASAANRSAADVLYGGTASKK